MLLENLDSIAVIGGIAPAGKDRLYARAWKRKAGVLDPVLTLALREGVCLTALPEAYLAGSTYLVDAPLTSSIDLSAPLRVPDISSLKVQGPKPASKKQIAMAESLLSEQSGVFGALSEMAGEDQYLQHLNRGVAQSMVMAKAPSTFNKYEPLVLKWQVFAARYGQGAPAFPANCALFVLYLQQLKNVAVSRGTKGSAVSDTVFAVDYAHRMRGLELPGKYEPARLLCTATRRLLARPVVKKRPVEKTEVVKMLDHAVPDFENIDLDGVRAALFAVLAFCLEARYDDLCDLRLSSFFDYGDYFVVYIEHRKTDQYREGQFVPVYDNGDPRGACAFLRAVLPVLGLGSLKDNLTVFRRIGHGKICGVYMRDQSLSYSRVRELVRELLEAIGLNPNAHGLHSFRAGAATHAANQPGISVEQWGKHGGWVNGSSAQTGYVLDSAQNALIVPNALAL